MRDKKNFKRVGLTFLVFCALIIGTQNFFGYAGIELVNGLGDVPELPEGYEIIGDSVVWENGYGRLEIYPHTSNDIITQTQYANITWKYPDNYIDVAFRFDEPISNPDIWRWANISHNVSVSDYGYVSANYTLYDILDIEVITESEANESGLCLGDIPSNYYRRGNASYWCDDLSEWWNDTFTIGFDSVEWLNPEHTSAIFYYEYWGVVGSHIEEQFWFDWKNVKHLFSHQEYNGKHYYYVSDIPVIQNKSYLFKWQYDIPVNSNGKWELLAKLHSDTIQEALSSGRYVMIDPWWDSNWQYHKTITVANKADDYQMKLFVGKSAGGNVTTEGHCNDNFSDLRFVYDNSTELPYWIQNYTSGEQATVWINNSGNYDNFDMFYGNSAVGTTSDGFTTFDVFDDFEDGNVDGWDVTGTTPTASTDHNYEAYGTKSCKFLTDDTASGLTINYADKSGVALQGFIYDDSSIVDVDDACMFQSKDASSYAMIGNYGIKTTSNYVYRLVSTYYDSGVARSTGWHEVILDYPDGVSVYVRFDDVLLVTGANPDTTARFQLGNPWAAQDAINYMDAVFIRKSIVANPTWSKFGSEQERANVAPSITGEIPADTSTGISLNPRLNVTVNDYNADTMDIYWYSNSTGAWVLFGSNLSTGNGTFFRHNANFTYYNTQYFWSVNVSDGYEWTNETYSFTTLINPIPEITLNSPLNGSGHFSSDLPITLNVSVSDAYGDIMRVRIYGDGVLFYTYNTTGNETVTYDWSCSSGLHQWNVSVNDSYNGGTAKNTVNSNVYWFAVDYFNDTFDDGYYYIDEYYAGTVSAGNYSFVLNRVVSADTIYPRISIGTDDGTENPTGSGTAYFVATSQWAYLGYYSISYKNMSTWARYQNVNLLNSANIISAIWAIYPYINDANVDVNVTCIDEDSCAAFTTGSRPWSRSHTEGYTDYLIGVGTNKWFEINITTAVQEVIDRPGWVSGNNLGVLGKGNDTNGDCRPRTYEYGIVYSPTLNITYDLLATYANITMVTVTKPDNADWEYFRADVNDTNCTFTIYNASTGYIRLNNLNASFSHDISMLYDDAIYVFGYFNESSQNMSSWYISWTAAAAVNIYVIGGRDGYSLAIALAIGMFFFIFGMLLPISICRKRKNQNNL